MAHFTTQDPLSLDTLSKLELTQVLLTTLDLPTLAKAEEDTQFPLTIQGEAYVVHVNSPSPNLYLLLLKDGLEVLGVSW
jgi:hypothetical protein